MTFCRCSDSGGPLTLTLPAPRMQSRFFKICNYTKLLKGKMVAQVQVLHSVCRTHTHTHTHKGAWLLFSPKLCFQIQCSWHQVHCLWWRWEPRKKAFHPGVWVGAAGAGSSVLREWDQRLTSDLADVPGDKSNEMLFVPGNKRAWVQRSQENDRDHPWHVRERQKGLHPSNTRKFHLCERRVFGF